MTYQEDREIDRLVSESLDDGGIEDWEQNDYEYQFKRVQEMDRKRQEKEARKAAMKDLEKDHLTFTNVIKYIGDHFAKKGK